MKSNDLVLLIVLGVLGYVVVQKLVPPTVVPSTATMNPSGGNLPATTSDVWASTADAISSVFKTIGSFAQSAPKTT